jgi:fatty acid-binding protein DegV
METIGAGRSASHAAALMADAITAAGPPLRVGVGWSNRSSLAVADELTGRVSASPDVNQVVRSQVGPSVGAHTGPGTAGAVFWRIA